MPLLGYSRPARMLAAYAVGAFLLAGIFAWLTSTEGAGIAVWEWLITALAAAIGAAFAYTAFRAARFGLDADKIRQVRAEYESREALHPTFDNASGRLSRRLRPSPHRSRQR